MIEYWLGIEKVLAIREAENFPTFLPGQPLELDENPFYVDDVSWRVALKEDAGTHGLAHKVTMVVRLEAV